MGAERKISRRAFLAAGGRAGAGLVLGFNILDTRAASEAQTASVNAEIRPNAWLRIAPDGQITVLVEIPEMGQGPRTIDAMMLAEELEADWSKIRVEQAPVIPGIYKNLSTGGSGGAGAAWDYMRKVGAQAREMLIAAAAQRWRVARSECKAENSTVTHLPSGRRASYGQLTAAAMKLPVPRAEDIKLKEPEDFRLIGKPVPRVDTPDKVDGTAKFGIDVRVPGMLFAVIARCPYFGGKLQSFDASAARAMPGVRAIFSVAQMSEFNAKLGINPNVAGGVAVVAGSTWAAIQARNALKITWDKGPYATESSESIRGRAVAGASAAPTVVVINHGDALKALQTAPRKTEATYELPFQAHATMEPMNTTVHVRPDGIEVWTPTQAGELVQSEIAALSGVPRDRITVHMMLCGGSFGRRYQWDYAAEAWMVAKQVKAPVQLLWTREDDMQRDFYRPYSYHRLVGSVDPTGRVAAWAHRIVSTPIRVVFDSPEQLKNPHHVASQELGVASVIPYMPENFRLDYFSIESPVPRAWWRSVSASFNAFAVECFIDELAHLAGKDPVDFRMTLVPADRKLPNTVRAGDTPLDTLRFRNTLAVAAEKSGWGTPMPSGHGRGIACNFGFDSYVAHVAEVSVAKDGSVRVHRIVSAVDCATAVNPDGVRAMTEGGINFALTQVLSGAITIKNAVPEQSNFDGYRVLRMNDAPDVEVYIIPGRGEPGGMGEAAVPALAPAIANAIFAATGKRIRRLPIDPAFLAGKDAPA